MTPIKDRSGNARWYKACIVASHERAAERVVEQIAMSGGFSFDGDIHVQRSCYAISEWPDGT
jgi:hypothetical protein